MRIAYVILILFFASNIYGQKIKTAELNLSSIKLDESIRITPATFETVTKEMSYMDKVDKNGRYLQDSLKILMKTAYRSNYKLEDGKYKLIEQEKIIDTIFYRSEPIIIRELVQEPEFLLIPDQYRTVPYYKLVKSKEYANHSKLIGYSEIVKKNLRETLSHQKLITDTSYEIIPANFTERPKSIKITGTKKEIKKFLKQPALKGIKYKFVKSVITN